MTYKEHPLSGYKVSVDGSEILKPSGDVCKVYQNKCYHSGKPTYYSVCGKVGGKGEPFSSVHRLVWETYVGSIPKGLVINHINGVKTDNRLCNLELCTYKENSQHAVLLGLNNPCLGEDNGMSKLKEEEVLEIYKLLWQGYNNEDIASVYNLHSRYVSSIRHGKKWKHLYEKQGKKFPKSFKYKMPIPSILTAWNLIKEGQRNVDISKLTGIEKSMISRLRTGSCYKDFIEFYDMKQQEEDQKCLNVT